MWVEEGKPKPELTVSIVDFKPREIDLTGYMWDILLDRSNVMHNAMVDLIASRIQTEYRLLLKEYGLDPLDHEREVIQVAGENGFAKKIQIGVKGIENKVLIFKKS